MVGIEVLILIVMILVHDKVEKNRDLNIDDMCLRVQAIVIIPSEFVYEEDLSNHFIFLLFGYFPCFCCYTPAAKLSAIPRCYSEKIDKNPQAHPSFRIGVSMVEWMLVIIWAMAAPERRKFLFSPNYGLIVFIVSVIFYFIHTQYLYFFPDFGLPNGIPIRSMYGYAFNGELEELERIKTPEFFKDARIVWDVDNPANSKLPSGIERDSIWGHAFYGELDEFKRKDGDKKCHKRHPLFKNIDMTPRKLAKSNNQEHIIEYIDGLRSGNFKRRETAENARSDILQGYRRAEDIQARAFWDTPQGTDDLGSKKEDTPAMYALSMGQFHVVKYLEKEKGATRHRDIFNQQNRFKFMNEKFARRYIGREYWTIEQ